MSDNAPQTTYLEFEDPDDPKSTAYESNKEKKSFRISIAPEMLLAVLIEEPKVLAPDVLPAVRRLMYASYQQGKQVGQEMEKRKLAAIV